MDLGNNLCNARKKSGLSQEEIAEKLGVSRQTISKWETNETLPDIRQAKRLSQIYNLSLDDLIDFDVDIKEIENIIEKTNEKIQKKVDWTKVWGKKYPVLITYKDEVDTKVYKNTLKELLYNLQKNYNYNDMDSFLVLKDILADIWNKKNK